MRYWMRLYLILAGFLLSIIPAQLVNAKVSAENGQIVEVQYFGLSALTPRDLEMSLPFAPGDQWKETFLEATKAGVESYYAKRGFYQARVTTRQSKTADENWIITINVEEGLPCKIIFLGFGDPPGIKGVANTRRFVSRMRNILNIDFGDRYDEEILADRLRRLREFLAKEDYILANTDSLKLTFNEHRTEARIDLDISYGDKVTFGFQNNTVFSKGELNEAITQLKSTELGKDYIGTIIRRFTENYKNLGYGNISIEAIQKEEGKAKHVTFVFNEGQRILIDSLKLEGFSPDNTREITGVFNREVSRLVQRGYYVEKDVDRGIQIVLEALRSKGYLAAKMMSKSVIPLKNKTKVAVSIQFYEGDQTIVDSLNLDGNQFLSNGDIESALGINVSKPFNPFRLEEGIQKLVSTYRDAGFLDFRIITETDKIATFTDNARKVSINIAMQEGVRIKIGDIRVEGLVKTREYVVLREVMIHTGDWWLANDVRALEDSIKRLGIFSEVRIRPLPSQKGPDYRDLLIDLKEGEPGVLEFGPGFRSDLGIRGFAQIGYNNLFGRNQSIALSGAVNRRLNLYQFPEYSLQTSFSDPRLFSTRNGFTAGLVTSKRSFIDFNASQTQFYTSIDRRLVPQVLGKLTYRLERVRQFGAVDAIDNQTLLIGSVTPSLVFDTRDNIFTTTKGQITTISFELAQPYFAAMSDSNPDGIGYYRWTASTHFYLTIFKDIVWSNVVGAGYEKNLLPRPDDRGVAQSPIPLIKTFRLGGYSSVRGFAEDSINRDRISIGGTLSYINLRTQIDLPLAGELKFSPFLDAGNLFVDDQFRGNPYLRAATGVGLHYMTPIGPINFDYGFKLNRLGSESLGQFHFSVGLI